MSTSEPTSICGGCGRAVVPENAIESKGSLCCCADCANGIKCGCPVRDVVCGMQLSPETSQFKVVREYCFCSARCRDQFLRQEQARQEWRSL